MRHRVRHRLVTALIVSGVVGGLAHSTPAVAEPDSEMPVPPGLFHLPPAMQFPPPPSPAGQNPKPYVGQPVFAPPTFNPVNGSMVGVAKPIIINFQRSIADRPLAEQAVHVSSNPPVPGKFYWMSDTQLRWRPIDFWPAHTTVDIDAGGTKASFRTGDALVATIDDATHQMEVVRNGKLEKTIPVSLGKKGYETPNGTYYVLERFADIVMDSSTYGVPIDSAEGYKLKVQDAVRISNSGIFVHGAPWSVNDQGKRNVSHGCPNLSPANAQWFYDNFGTGDPVVVKNSVGTYNENDGAQDWQI
jgi:lipoprotein-anchoring transpeptidase ErfK/SrfK